MFMYFKNKLYPDCGISSQFIIKNISSVDHERHSENILPSFLPSFIFHIFFIPQAEAAQDKVA